MGVGDFNGRGALTGAGDIIALGALIARGALMGCGPLTGRGPVIGYVFVNERGPPYGHGRTIEHAGQPAGLPSPVHVHAAPLDWLFLAARGMDTRHMQHFIGHCEYDYEPKCQDC